MDEDAELCILVPLRLLVFDKRGPIGTVGSIVRLLVGFGQQTVALRVVFVYRLLPLAIDLLGGFDVLRPEGERIRIRRRPPEQGERGRE